MRIGDKAYACIPSRDLKDAWFNLEVQRSRLFEQRRVDLVVDVGANAGQFGRALRRSYAGELLSFEPASAAFKGLQAASAADKAWRPFRYALGDENTHLDLRLSPLSAFNSFFSTSHYCESRFGEAAVPTALERVPVRRLDELISELVPDVHQRRLFVKLDTQGFDLNVFRGMQGILDRVVAFQSEVSLRALYDGAPAWLECMRVYEAAGFHVGGMYPVTLDANGHPIEYDCLMIAG
jgi:FkbM family methyltransferase